jgi:hypothetical protein
MSCVTTTCAEHLTLDPFKRVCYSQGLVLGVDEFVQEELYFLEQHRWHHRGLHGYGTVCGLDVAIRDTSQGPEVFVAPGMAIDPRGRRIRVGAAQCAQLNAWLARFGHTLGSPGTIASPGVVELFLRLCYRECSTDRVPIPSGPCRSSDATSVPSRVLDDFTLELTTSAPDQIEADTVRQFGALLRAIEFSDAGLATLSLDDLKALVRALAPNAPTASPPLPAPPSGSPPGVWRIHPSDAEAYLRAAFRLWVTEVRPSLLPDGGNCAQGPPEADCILLARLEFPITDGVTGLLVHGTATAVAVDEGARPYLLHTQLLQELFLGGAFVAEPGTKDHSALINLDQDDHQQYLLVAPPGDPAHPAQRALLDHLPAAGHQIKGLANGTDAGDAMPIGQGASGDLAETYPKPTVVKIQGLDVLKKDPADKDVLTWVNAQQRWEPKAIELPPAPAAAPTNFEPSLIRIFGLSWTHQQPHDFFFKLDDEEARGLAMAFGRRRFADAQILVGTDGTRHDLGSFDDCSFEAFVETAGEMGLLRRLRIPAVDIVPIEPGPEISPGFFTAGRRVHQRTGYLPVAPAVFVRFDHVERAMTTLNVTRVYVALSGDHVLDEKGEKAIDAELLRARLRTGDRPEAADVGLQGGRFRSWFPYQVLEDVNRIDRDGLIALGLTAAIANRVIALRESQPHGIRALDELAGVTGMTPARLTALRNALAVRE